MSSCTSLWLVAPLVLLASPFGTQAQANLGSHPEQRIPGTTVRIELIGDSTQTDNAGYGRGFCANVTVQVDCVNMAKGGSSTKTFREDGLWDRSLSTKPDYMLIQFGHNDMESPDHLPRQVPIAVYEANLRRLIDEARAHQIKPILVTPLTRRYFEQDGTIHSDLLHHAAVVKRVAAEMHVPLIDLQAESIAYLDALGETKAQALGLSKKNPDGSLVPDKTHLNWEGSYVFGRMVAVDMGKAVPELQQYVKPEPAKLSPVGVLAMRMYHQEPFEIVLVGDSTVATEGGWGPGFCATLTPNVTCTDLAANGRSTKSFLDEGRWQAALDRHAAMYLIQFGHNDQKPAEKLHTDPGTTYDANLRRFIDDVRAQGGIPVILSPLTRRTYDASGKLVADGLKDYANAARRVADENHVTFIDLLGLSQKFLSTRTQQQADQYNATTHPDAVAENGNAAKPDRTHLNHTGQMLFGRMVVDNLIRIEVELGPDVKGMPDSQNPVLQPAPTDGK